MEKFFIFYGRKQEDWIVVGVDEIFSTDSIERFLYFDGSESFRLQELNVKVWRIANAWMREKVHCLLHHFFTDFLNVLLHFGLLSHLRCIDMLNLEGRYQLPGTHEG